MGFRGVVEVTKFFPDGHIEVATTLLLPTNPRSEDIPCFEMDGEAYYWPRGTKSGSEVLYKLVPSRKPYHKMIAKLLPQKRTEIKHES